MKNPSETNAKFKLWAAIVLAAILIGLLIIVALNVKASRDEAARKEEQAKIEEEAHQKEIEALASSEEPLSIGVVKLASGLKLTNDETDVLEGCTVKLNPSEERQTNGFSKRVETISSTPVVIPWSEFINSGSSFDYSQTAVTRVDIASCSNAPYRYASYGN